MEWWRNGVMDLRKQIISRSLFSSSLQYATTPLRRLVEDTRFEYRHTVIRLTNLMNEPCPS